MNNQDSNNQPATNNSSDKPVQQTNDAANVYPQATKGRAAGFDGPSLAQAPNKKNNLLPVLAIFIVGLVVGIIVGRTILKPDVSLEEATKRVFGELTDEFSEQFNESSFFQESE